VFILFIAMHLFGHGIRGGHGGHSGHVEEGDQKGHAGHVPGISRRGKIMKKAIEVLAIVFLSSMAAQAQMGGGMMGGGGMMNKGQGGESQESLTTTPGAGIFSSNCASCHPNGRNVVTPNLPLKGSRMLADFKTFLNFIRNPKMPDGSKGAMAAFTKSIISDRQAERLYQFIIATDSSGKSRY
jgi:mono/diheme cytochrome c family protein